MFIPYKKGSYVFRSKFREILKLFLLDIEATKISVITKINRPTINKIIFEIRQVIANEYEKNAVLEVGEIELDENYFGARSMKGVRGRGAKGKVPVFGMLKRGDKVYTQIVNS